MWGLDHWNIFALMTAARLFLMVFFGPDGLVGGFAVPDPVVVVLRDDVVFDLDVDAETSLDVEVVVETSGG